MATPRIVWAKISRMWWPGEVTEDYPPDVVAQLRKAPLAVIKFFNEDSYETIQNAANMQEYRGEKRVELIKKGLMHMKSQQSEEKEKFIKDVKEAETRTGGNPEEVDDIKKEAEAPQTPKRPSYMDIFKPTPPKEPVVSTPTPSIKFNFKKVAKTPTLQKKEAYLSSKPQQSGPPKKYSCDVCGFSSDRVGVLTAHRKLHSNTDGNVLSSPAAKRNSISSPAGTTATGPAASGTSSPVKPKADPPKSPSKEKTAPPKKRGRKKKEQAKEDILNDWSDEEEFENVEKVTEEVEESSAPLMKKPRTDKELSDAFEALLQSTQPPTLTADSKDVKEKMPLPSKDPTDLEEGMSSSLLSKDQDTLKLNDTVDDTEDVKNDDVTKGSTPDLGDANKIRLSEISVELEKSSAQYNEIPEIMDKVNPKGETAGGDMPLPVKENEVLELAETPQPKEYKTRAKAVETSVAQENKILVKVGKPSPKEDNKAPMVSEKISSPAAPQENQKSSKKEKLTPQANKTPLVVERTTRAKRNATPVVVEVNSKPKRGKTQSVEEITAKSQKSQTPPPPVEDTPKTRRNRTPSSGDKNSKPISETPTAVEQGQGSKSRRGRTPSVVEKDLKPQEIETPAAVEVTSKTRRSRTSSAGDKNLKPEKKEIPPVVEVSIKFRRSRTPSAPEKNSKPPKKEQLSNEESNSSSHKVETPSVVEKNSKPQRSKTTATVAEGTSRTRKSRTPSNGEVTIQPQQSKTPPTAEKISKPQESEVPLVVEKNLNPQQSKTTVVEKSRSRRSKTSSAAAEASVPSNNSGPSMEVKPVPPQDKVSRTVASNEKDITPVDDLGTVPKESTVSKPPVPEPVSHDLKARMEEKSSPGEAILHVMNEAIEKAKEGHKKNVDDSKMSSKSLVKNSTTEQPNTLPTAQIRKCPSPAVATFPKEPVAVKSTPALNQTSVPSPIKAAAQSKIGLTNSSVNKNVPPASQKDLPVVAVKSSPILTEPSPSELPSQVLATKEPNTPGHKNSATTSPTKELPIAVKSTPVLIEASPSPKKSEITSKKSAAKVPDVAVGKKEKKSSAPPVTPVEKGKSGKKPVQTYRNKKGSPAAPANSVTKDSIVANKTPEKPTAAIKPTVSTEDDSIIRQALQGTLKSSPDLQPMPNAKPSDTETESEREAGTEGEVAKIAEQVVHLVPVENPDGTVTYMLLSLGNQGELCIDATEGAAPTVGTDAIYVDKATDGDSFFAAITQPNPPNLNPQPTVSQKVSQPNKHAVVGGPTHSSSAPQVVLQNQLQGMQFIQSNQQSNEVLHISHQVEGSAFEVAAAAPEPTQNMTSASTMLDLSSLGLTTPGAPGVSQIQTGQEQTHQIVFLAEDGSIINAENVNWSDYGAFLNS